MVAQQPQDYRVLVADDEPEVVDLVEMMLEMEGGYSTLSALDGLQTLECIRAERPDLVLLDVRMPRLSGLAVLDRLRVDPITADIPVIMLSVAATYPDVRTALERGAIAYLAKPFELREMTRLIAQVLEMSIAERQELRQRALDHVTEEW
jgi:two-component system alkaline phosphatase synthesis response regulator PhoP